MYQKEWKFQVGLTYLTSEFICTKATSIQEKEEEDQWNSVAEPVAALS